MWLTAPTYLENRYPYSSVQIVNQTNTNVGSQGLDCTTPHAYKA
jgi:hypothetical protein